MFWKRCCRSIAATVRCLTWSIIMSSVTLTQNGGYPAIVPTAPEILFGAECQPVKVYWKVRVSGDEMVGVHRIELWTR